jgi:hypothetical protein
MGVNLLVQVGSWYESASGDAVHIQARKEKGEGGYFLGIDYGARGHYPTQRAYTSDGKLQGVESSIFDLVKAIDKPKFENEKLPTKQRKFRATIPLRRLWILTALIGFLVGIGVGMFLPV